MKSIITFYWILSFTIVSAETKAVTQAHKLLEKIVPADGPGIIALVSKNGEIVFHEAFGMAHVSKKIPVDKDTEFYIASLSKPFTAMAIQILEAEGKLNFTDSLKKHLPAFPAYAEKITIQHLLQHTAGLPDYMAGVTGKEAALNSMKSALLYLTKFRKPKFAPGEKHSYSNSSYIALAAIVEKLSGQNFPDFCQKRIFTPARMNSSWVISQSAEKRDSVIPSYCGKKQTETFLNDPLDWVYGDGGVITTAADLHSWTLAIDSGKILSKEKIKSGLTTGKTNAGKVFDYGYGWVLAEDYHWHNGSWRGFGSVLVRIPKQNIDIILLTNNENYDLDALSSKFMKLEW